MRFLEVLLNGSTWLFKDPRHKEINQQKNGQHDNALNILAHISSCMSSTYVLSIRFRWDMDVMSFDSYLMLGVMFPSF